MKYITDVRFLAAKNLLLKFNHLEENVWAMHPQHDVFTFEQVVEQILACKHTEGIDAAYIMCLEWLMSHYPFELEILPPKQPGGEPTYKYSLLDDEACPIELDTAEEFCALLGVLP